MASATDFYPTAFKIIFGYCIFVNADNTARIFVDDDWLFDGWRGVKKS
jgi:hypothetical protein